MKRLGPLVIVLLAGSFISILYVIALVIAVIVLVVVMLTKKAVQAATNPHLSTPLVRPPVATIPSATQGRDNIEKFFTWLWKPATPGWHKGAWYRDFGNDTERYFDGREWTADPVTATSERPAVGLAREE